MNEAAPHQASPPPTQERRAAASPETAAPRHSVHLHVERRIYERTTYPVQVERRGAVTSYRYELRERLHVGHGLSYFGLRLALPIVRDPPRSFVLAASVDAPLNWDLDQHDLNPDHPGLAHRFGRMFQRDQRMVFEFSIIPQVDPVYGTAIIDEVDLRVIDCSYVDVGAMSPMARKLYLHRTGKVVIGSGRRRRESPADASQPTWRRGGLPAPRSWP